MTESASKKIAQNIKKARLEKGLTQETLAKKAGINSNYYAKVERGELNPSLETISKILKALDIKSSDVLPF